VNTLGPIICTYWTSGWASFCWRALFVKWASLQYSDSAMSPAISKRCRGYRFLLHRMSRCVHFKEPAVTLME